MVSVRAVAGFAALVGVVAAGGRGAGQTPDGALADAVTAQSSTELTELYRPNAFAPLWLAGEGRLTDSGRDALRLLAFANSDGLSPDDYAVRALREQAESIEKGSAGADDRAHFDVALSASMLAYLHDLQSGRRNARRTAASPVDSASAGLPGQLRAAAASRQVVGLVTASRPHDPQYALLSSALARYRESTLRNVPPLKPGHPTVHPGDRFDALERLWSYLVIVGDAPADSVTPSDDRYTGVVVDAVKHFQRRHALDPDGVIGPRTMAELSVPLSWRVRQIELAMERLRWLPRRGAEQRLVIVNIPMFTLSAWETLPPSSAPAFSTRVIVGKAVKTETPMFEAVLTEILFRPYWNVPMSIVRGEVLPTLARQPDYLVREQLELVAGETDASPVVAASAENLALLRQGRLRLRQRPGPKNALGLVKFSFPNPFDVYMHATPVQALFSRSRRDFSHGCVRIEDPVGLAAWVLAAQPRWTPQQITDAMNAQMSSRVRVEHPVRVILRYATAVVSMETGDTLFAEDIYGLDRALDREMREPRSTLPGANASGVDVHEIRRWVETDAATPDVDSGLSQLGERNVGQADVDRLPLHVQAAGCDALGTLPEHRVGLR